MRFKCTVMYDGTAYCGYQTQANGPTIQETIEKAISRVTNENIKIIAAGRTDTRVHAVGQVFHFDTMKDHTIFRLKYAINGALPKDIHITDMEIVDENFHARYAVKSKQYDYHILMETPDVFKRNYSTFIKKKLDVDAMKEASKAFIGRHDFTSFCATTKEEMEDQTREVYDISFTQEENELIIHYYGEGFMRYMVRMMSAALIEAGLHKMTKEDISILLAKKSKTAFNKNAEPQGLVLMHIDYYHIIYNDEELIIRDQDVHENYDCKYVIAYRKTNEVIGLLKDPIEWLKNDEKNCKKLTKISKDLLTKN